MPARGHLFFSPKKVYSSPEMESFVKDQRNCRRLSLVASVGGVAEKNDGIGCCDLCGGDPVSSRLKIHASSVVGKRKARRVRRMVDPNLEDRLKEIRETVLSEHPAFKMLGVNFLCPDSTIKRVCEEAKYAKEFGDFSVHLRAELRYKFLSETLSCTS